MMPSFSFGSVRSSMLHVTPNACEFEAETFDFVENFRDPLKVIPGDKLVDDRGKRRFVYFPC